MRLRARAILIWITPFLVAGCNSPEPEFYWFHPDKTIYEAKADYDECELKAQEEAAKVVEDRYFDGLRSPAVLRGGEEQESGKSKSDDPALQARSDWGELYKQNAFSGCMQSQGYVRLRPHQVSPDLKIKDLPMGGIAGKRPRR